MRTVPNPFQNLYNCKKCKAEFQVDIDGYIDAAKFCPNCGSADIKLDKKWKLAC